MFEGFGLGLNFILMTKKQTIVVIGGGFAGINLIQNLNPKFYDVILIDKINHHQFQPLFYQVATSQIEPSSISFPLRHIFRNYSNVRIRLANVSEINENEKFLITSIGKIEFDILVIAAGCKTNFFGSKNIENHALTLKSTYDAISIRNHILQIFEDIVTAKAPEKEALLNIVIVGAGPTGVELAGAFAEIKSFILPRDYPRIDFSELKIILVEGSPNTLNNMSDKAKTSSKMYLQNLGVEIHTETTVSDYNGLILNFSDGTALKTKTLIWAAGVIANEFNGLPESCFTFGKRIKVDRYNLVQGLSNIYAVGDIAFMSTPLYPKGHPQVANVAINQSINLAKNLNRVNKNVRLQPYEYKNLGSMATIGRNKAVVDLPFVQLKGFIAWVIWMFLHLMLILSVRNKLIIFINWAWAYFTKDTALRLILKEKS